MKRKKGAAILTAVMLGLLGSGCGGSGPTADNTKIYYTAIESGDYYEGWASEIAKLAQTCMTSVRNIDALVLRIQTLIGDVIAQANSSVESINDSSTLIGNAVVTFDTIFENIMAVGGMVQNMMQKVEQVEDVARNVAAISEEQAASSDEILRSSDVLVEQADGLMANSESVARESEELTTSAEELETQIKMFKI